jgi:hypothetical protein
MKFYFLTVLYREPSLILGLQYIGVNLLNILCYKIA